MQLHKELSCLGICPVAGKALKHALCSDRAQIDKSCPEHAVARAAEIAQHAQNCPADRFWSVQGMCRSSAGNGVVHKHNC